MLIKAFGVSVSNAGGFFMLLRRMRKMKKRTMASEAAYALGMVILALGTALMEKADFGMSMVVAPAYILHLKVVQFLPFFSFGMAEYTLQAVLLCAMMLMLRRFRVHYLFSFVTAVLYGLLLDGALFLAAYLPVNMALRAVYYALGMVVCSLGVALLFRTYISPEVYELFVREAANKYGKKIPAVKTVYDCVSCLIAVALSFAFFGLWHFEGVKWGTVLCALVNGWLIGKISGALEKKFEIKDVLSWRKYFA